MFGLAVESTIEENCEVTVIARVHHGHHERLPRAPIGFAPKAREWLLGLVRGLAGEAVLVDIAVPPHLLPVHVHGAGGAEQLPAFRRRASRPQSLGSAPLRSVGRHALLKKKQSPAVWRQAFLRLLEQLSHPGSPGGVRGSAVPGAGKGSGSGPSAGSGWPAKQ